MLKGDLPFTSERSGGDTLLREGIHAFSLAHGGFLKFAEWTPSN